MAVVAAPVLLYCLGGAQRADRTAAPFVCLRNETERNTTQHNTGDELKQHCAAFSDAIYSSSRSNQFTVLAARLSVCLPVCLPVHPSARLRRPVPADLFASADTLHRRLRRPRRPDSKVRRELTHRSIDFLCSFRPLDRRKNTNITSESHRLARQASAGEGPSRSLFGS